MMIRSVMVLLLPPLFFVGLLALFLLETMTVVDVLGNNDNNYVHAFAPSCAISRTTTEKRRRAAAVMTILQQQQQQQQQQQEFQLPIQNFKDPPSSSSSTFEILPPPSISTALDFVDNLLLLSSSSSSSSSHPVCTTGNESILLPMIPTRDEILNRVQKQHAMDYQAAVKSPLALEELRTDDDNDDDDGLHSHFKEESSADIPYEWIYSRLGDGTNDTTTATTIAVQSLTPVLNATEIASIQNAAETIWRRQRQQHDDSLSSSSRFTYQFKGNSEAHAADFATLSDDDHHNPSSAIEVINKLLLERLYPWVRQVFLQPPQQQQYTKSNTSPMFVYDALVIRYNASASDTGLAGQPLHRDLGVVSVNIMLNDAFEGGGTYFDNQAEQLVGGMVDCDEYGGRADKKQQHVTATIKPIKPSGGPGCCIAHLSNARHAGAGTHAGVRDVLVFFLSVKDLEPPLLNAHLKQTRSSARDSDDINSNNRSMQPPQKDKDDSSSSSAATASILSRLQHQRLAIEALPDDGEAYLYLGSALMDYAKLLTVDDSDRIITLRQAHICLEHASVLIPNDARVWNNWGIVSARLEGEWKGCCIGATAVKEIYQRGLDLLLAASAAGCSVQDDLNALSLNYGLYLANQDSFAEACDVLAAPASTWREGEPVTKTIGDAYRLWKWCKGQIFSLQNDD